MRKQAIGKIGGRQILGLKYHRLRAGLLQYHAAQAIGVHVSRLAKLERGILKPRQEELEALAKLYAVEAHSLTHPCKLFQEPQRGPESEDLKDYRDRTPGKPRKPEEAKEPEPKGLGETIRDGIKEFFGGDEGSEEEEPSHHE